MLCPFYNNRDLFGEPNTGVHSYRFLNIAIVDYVLTILLAGLVSYMYMIPLDLITILLFILGIMLHVLFGVNTATIKYLGISC
jgi:hypothetical protein